MPWQREELRDGKAYLCPLEIEPQALVMLVAAYHGEAVALMFQGWWSERAGGCRMARLWPWRPCSESLHGNPS